MTVALTGSRYCQGTLFHFQLPQQSQHLFHLLWLLLQFPGTFRLIVDVRGCSDPSADLPIHPAPLCSCFHSRPCGATCQFYKAQAFSPTTSSLPILMFSGIYKSYLLSNIVAVPLVLKKKLMRGLLGLG